MFINQSRNIIILNLNIQRGKLAIKKFIKLTTTNLIYATIKKIKIFRILKCVMKRECVTSQVRKNVRGDCILLLLKIYRCILSLILNILHKKEFKSLSHKALITVNIANLQKFKYKLNSQLQCCFLLNLLEFIC